MTTLFTYFQSELNALHRSGSKYLEVDVSFLNGVPAQGGNKTMETNLPGAYLDVDFSDSTRTLTVGSTQTSRLSANFEYRATVHLRNFSIKADVSQIALGFQRGHWAPKTNPTEAASCYDHGGSDPAWCVFADHTWIMRPELGPAVFVEMRKPYVSTVSTTWGRYRTNALFPVNQMVPGDRLYSPNGLNYLFMQSDGNLVEYIPGRSTWASNTAGRYGSVFLAQGDGNYVVVSPGNIPRWATGTRSNGTVLKIQDDRNVAVYAPGNIAIWSNNVAGQP